MMVTNSHPRVRVGDVVSFSTRVYSPRERALSWLIGRGWRGRLVWRLFHWGYRPVGHEARREWRVTAVDGCSVTIDRAGLDT
jgi:hypothetical protein